jgi:uncharacterized protein (TIGR02217 family)
MIDDVRFPEDISYGAQGGPRFVTQIVVSGRGKERRNRLWRRALHQFSVSHEMLRPDESHALLDFFFARQGKTRGFRFKWWMDYSTDQPIAGAKHALLPLSATVFQLQKLYTDAGGSYARRITRPVAETVHLYHPTTGVELTSGFTLDANTGKVTFAVAPGYTPEATFEFDLPVRFGTDEMEMVDVSLVEQEWTRIPLVEILEGDSLGLGGGGTTAFTETRFPEDIANGAQGGPRFVTAVIKAESGAEGRTPIWPRGRHRFDVSHALRNPEQAQALLAFFYCRGGRHQGFRLKWQRDYSTDQPEAGAKHTTAPIDSTRFQLQKVYTSGSVSYARPITKPRAETVRLYRPDTGALIASSDYVLDDTTGVVTFDSAPGFTPKARFEFDCAVRFDSDEMQMTDESGAAASWPRIPIVELP